jgi:NADH-quinone oxidoreductase subunit E
MCSCQTAVDLTRLEPVFAAHAHDPHALIAILQEVQAIYGYLPTPVLYEIAARTDRTPANVMGVATFYTQFRLTPVGRHLILVCKGTACHVNGADAVEAALKDELGIGDGETTPDGLFSLKSVACLGCCSLSPVMMIGDETFGSLTPAKARAIVRRIKTESVRP